MECKRPAVLIVDDDEEICDLIREELSEKDYVCEVSFSADDALAKLKRNSFVSRVIACTPDHSSYKHQKSRRDYFSHIGTGLYKLNDEYRVYIASDGTRIS